VDVTGSAAVQGTLLQPAEVADALFVDVEIAALQAVPPLIAADDHDAVRPGARARGASRR
jgi:hypothetical protein